MCLGKYLACFLVLLTSAVAARGDASAIGQRLSRAEAAFEMERASRRAVVLAALDKRVEAAAARGDTQQVHQLEMQRAAFVESGRLPPAVVYESAWFERTMRDARNNLARVYHTAADQLRQAGEQDEADLVADKRLALLDDSAGWDDLLYRIQRTQATSAAWQPHGSSLDSVGLEGCVLGILDSSAQLEFNFEFVIERLEGAGPIFFHARLSKGLRGMVRIDPSDEGASLLAPGENHVVRVRVRNGELFVKHADGDWRIAVLDAEKPQIESSAIGSVRFALVVDQGSRVRLQSARLRTKPLERQPKAPPVRRPKEPVDLYALGTRWIGEFVEHEPNVGAGKCDVEVIARNGNGATLRIRCDNGATWDWSGRTRGDDFHSNSFEQVAPSKNAGGGFHRFFEMQAKADVDGDRLTLSFWGTFSVSKVDTDVFAENARGSRSINVDICGRSDAK